jgi:hypothetical protein
VPRGNWNLKTGNDTDNSNGGVATLSLQLPVYEGVTFYLDGRYAGLADDKGIYDYRYSTFMTGIRMSL